MDRQSYKLLHETFVSNHKGTTLAEVTIVSLVCPLSVFILIKLGRLIGRPANFATEFIILAGPLLMIFTQDFIAYAIILAFAAFALVLARVSSSSDVSSVKYEERHLAFLTNYRASMLLVTAICILGVDFQAYPRRFAKTEELGFGLMDIGVGSFIFSAGIVAPIGSSKLMHNVGKSIPLFVLGALKYCSVKMLDYHEHVSEYGMHWNFFITMGFVQLVCGFVTCKFDKKYAMLIAMVIACLHEYLLVTKNYQWIFTLTKAQRTEAGLLVANAEGVVSLAGFSALFLMGAYLKSTIYSLLRAKENLVKASLGLVLLWSVFVILTNEAILVPPSRRLCNLSYVIWMVAYNMMLIVSYASIQFSAGNA